MSDLDAVDALEMADEGPPNWENLAGSPGKYSLQVAGNTHGIRCFSSILCTEQKLRTLIEARSMPLGETDSGKAWCLKALHPSDPLVEVRGIPDKSSVPSVFLNYQSTFVLGPPEDAVGSWGFDLDFTPHPVSFCSYRAFDAGNAHTAVGNFLNSQLTGATHGDKYAAFKTLAQRWRMAYGGISVYQDSAALSNQGTIVACQAACEPRTLQPLIGAADSFKYATTPMHVFSDSDEANFVYSQNMPNSYFGTSKDGCYLPLRMTKTCQAWHSEADEVVMGAVTVSAPKEGSAALNPIGTAVSWPFYGLNPPYLSADGLFAVAGAVTSPFCNDVTGRISAENLALTTRYALFVRMGFEIQVLPGSLMSPHQMLSPPYDSTALKAYFMISRELKDAYPENYNSLGKLWDVISGAAKTVLPILKMIPGIGTVAGLVEGGVSIGDKIKAAATGKGQPSQADRDRAKVMVEEITQARRKVASAGAKKRAKRNRGPRASDAAPAAPVTAAQIKKALSIIRQSKA